MLAYIKGATETLESTETQHGHIENRRKYLASLTSSHSWNQLETRRNFSLQRTGKQEDPGCPSSTLDHYSLHHWGPLLVWTPGSWGSCLGMKQHHASQNSLIPLCLSWSGTASWRNNTLATQSTYVGHYLPGAKAEAVPWHEEATPWLPRVATNPST